MANPRSSSRPLILDSGRPLGRRGPRTASGGAEPAEDPEKGEGPMPEAQIRAGNSVLNPIHAKRAADVRRHTPAPTPPARGDGGHQGKVNLFVF